MRDKWVSRMCRSTRVVLPCDSTQPLPQPCQVFLSLQHPSPPFPVYTHLNVLPCDQGKVSPSSFRAPVADLVKMT